jgi:hypothetical protein
MRKKKQPFKTHLPNEGLLSFRLLPKLTGAMHLLVWQARNLDVGVNMDGFWGTCVYLLWHAP